MLGMRTHARHRQRLNEDKSSKTIDCGLRRVAYSAAISFKALTHGGALLASRPIAILK